MMNHTDPQAESASPQPTQEPTSPPPQPSAPTGEQVAAPQSQPTSSSEPAVSQPVPADQSKRTPTPDALRAEVEAELDEALKDADIEQLMAAADQQRESEAGQEQDAGKSGERQRFELDVRRGRISAITGEDVFVDVAGMEGKNQGVVPLSQFERPPRIGSIMDFVVDRVDESGGLLILSREGVVGRATWDSIHKGAVVEGRVTASNKGGLELELVGSIRAFMPASQVDIHRVDDLDQFVGQKLAGTVQEIDRKKKSVVISRRAYLQQERESLKQKVWEEIEVGQVREGVVARLLPYGAFVDIGGIDGMVHVSDMSYTHIDKPESVLSVGQKVQVKVLKVEREKDRISLGIKQVAPDPWEGIEGRITPGTELSGRVLRLADFGAFIEVEPGVEGLLPVSEISWGRVNKPSDQLKEGDVIRLKVLQVDPGKRRISLSLRQSQGDPWVGVQHKYPVGAEVQAKVISTVEFGAFAELEPGVEGMVHISELSDRRVGKVTDVVNVGDVKTMRVIQVDEDARRIKLSMKPAQSAQPAPEQEQQQAPRPTAKKPVPKGNLKGGMDKHGGLGVGLKDLKL